MRGEIHARERAKQQKDYSRLRVGTITPTDLDGVIEFRDRAWILFEFKYGTDEMPRGQELAMVRLCDDLTQVKPAILIVAEHQAHDPRVDIPCGDLVWSRAYWGNGPAHIGRYWRGLWESNTFSTDTVRDKARRYLDLVVTVR